MAEVKCAWKFCKNESKLTRENAILDDTSSRKKYFCSEECKKQFNQFKQIKDIYNKYVSETENWMLIQKTLHNWMKKYSVEYILFVLCKAIRWKEIYGVQYKGFMSLYSFLNDNKYKIAYKNHINGDEMLQFGENVKLTKNQYSKLCDKYSENIVKVFIDKMNKWCKQHGRNYSDYYVAIEKWIEDNNKKQLNRHG